MAKSARIAEKQFRDDGGHAAEEVRTVGVLKTHECRARRHDAGGKTSGYIAVAVGAQIRSALAPVRAARSAFQVRG